LWEVRGFLLRQSLYQINIPQNLSGCSTFYTYTLKRGSEDMGKMREKKKNNLKME
jgi:hypothetical protein